MGNINKDILYSLDDVAIMPNSYSTIEHRSSCNPFIDNGMLPIFTAPMSNVVGVENYNTFKSNYIEPILPRTVSIDKRMRSVGDLWCAFSLSEFENFFIKTTASSAGKTMKVLIDIANGNMSILMDMIKKSKEKYGSNILIMAGNVANPETYRLLSFSGADYVRLSVGCGNSCITSTNTGVHYPMASLIEKCYQIYEYYTKEGGKMAYIIADGGMKNYSDIIKSLAIGAHFVMCGSIFNKCLESSAKTYVKCADEEHKDLIGNEVDNNNEEIVKLFKEKKIILEKEFYGMSTKKAQIEMGKIELKTGEGLFKRQIVEYTLDGWVENFIDYLRSAMSYTNSIDLSTFSHNAVLNVISNNSFNLINK